MHPRSIYSILVLLLLAGPIHTAQACSVCFGAPGDKTTEAMGSAILLLLVIIVAILTSLLGFLFYLFKKARESGPLTMEQFREATQEWKG